MSTYTVFLIQCPFAFCNSWLGHFEIYCHTRTCWKNLLVGPKSGYIIWLHPADHPPSHPTRWIQNVKSWVCSVTKQISDQNSFRGQHIFQDQIFFRDQNLDFNAEPWREYSKASNEKPIVDLECGPTQPQLVFPFVIHNVLKNCQFNNLMNHSQLITMALYWHP